MSAAAFNPAKFLPSAAYRKAGIITVENVLQGTAPATAGNWNHFFVAPYACVVLSCDAVWSTASGAGGTLQLEKLTGTTAKGSGTDMLSAAIAVDGTANTVANGALVTTKSTIQLATGDRLAIDDDSTTLTSLANLLVQVVLAPIPSKT